MPFTKIITLTDIHILPDGERLIGIDPFERLALAVDHVNRTQADAQMVIVTGDLTHRADARSYERLRDGLSRLKLPVKLLLGNHDEREPFLAAFQQMPVDENGFAQFAIDLDGWRLIGLDPLNGPPYVYPERHAGYLCEKRLAFLDKAIAGADGRPVMIFMHHPPFDTGFPGMDRIKLNNHEAFHALIAGRNVRQIVCGHIHRSISVSWKGIPATVYKSLVDQMPFDLISVDSSLAVAEPPAYGVLLMDTDTVVCHSVEFLSEPAVPGIGGHT